MKILVLNAGSSSQKSCLYEITGDTLPLYPPQPLWESKVSWTTPDSGAEVKITTVSGITFQEKIPALDRSAAMVYTINKLWQGQTQSIDQLSDIDVVGHRVVHGGTQYRQSTIITAEVKKAIKDLAAFAPLHNSINLAGIVAMEQLLSDTPQVAAFDTAFHTQLPLAATVYPGPYTWYQQGIQRYGFHGISHQYCATRAAQLLGRSLADLRLIVCHLGNGCSLAAIRDGHSVDTTMGFTPLEGLMMGTRSGSIDPGILIYLLREQGYTADQLEQILNQESGLQGISGLSADIRQILAAAVDYPRAQLAFDIFIQRLRSSIGAMLMSLDRLDALIFTAGIGENAAAVRAAACAGLDFLGLNIDNDQNEQQPMDVDIATATSKARIFVIQTQEDWAIAQDCWQILNL
jgi:acetate kinase